MTRVRAYVDTFSLGERTTSALEHTIEELRAQGRTVALVALPVLESAWASWHEHGMADIEAYRESLAAIGERHNVPLFAYPGELQDESLYRDPVHLNGEGSSRFTARLGEDLGQWMRDGGATCGGGSRRQADREARSAIHDPIAGGRLLPSGWPQASADADSALRCSSLPKDSVTIGR